ncbi:MAG TPA: primosomal protein N' [Ignavibacteriaceae bacterium]|nr:primosomal protein N' [Ignavibacteriaceae bacterium]
MFAELVFPLPFRNTFTYSIPKDYEDVVEFGMRAAAPFGKRVLTGFVVNVTDTTNTEHKIKPLIEVLDEKPIITKKSLEFYKWIAEYYMCSLGEALKLSIPYGLEVESKRKIVVDKELCIQLLAKEKKSKTREKILKVLSEKEVINLTLLQKLIKKKNIYSIMRSLEQTGAITILDEIEDEKVKIKKVKYVKLAKPLADIYSYIPEIEKKSPIQVRALLEILNKKNKVIRLKELADKEISSSAISSLKKKGFVEVFEKAIDRNYVEVYNEQLIDFELTDEQKEVIEKVNCKIDNSSFNTFLLYGVTGSGKTQVYIELIKKVIAKNKSALVLVPEISLTPQITSRLLNNFKDNVAVLHSRMSLGERYDAWRKILNGKCQIVVGARSALFAPLKNLGIIIVDEEHDGSYKQSDSTPKYNGRDSAIMLGAMSKCPVVLGSATPSLESMHNVLTNKYELLKLTKRIDDALLPKISLVDVSVEQRKKKMKNIFSSVLLDKIDDRLNKKEGVIILQNRRGFSTSVFCIDCGKVEECTNCSVPMVYHINDNKLQCHYCGIFKPVPVKCPNCGSLSLKYFGTGTEKVEDELAFHFPQAKISRIDSDSISRKSSLSKILFEFSKGEVDILVGTQMVSKGLDFSHVSLVGVVSAETSLWLPDFRADERTFQLLTQVSGRAGRSKIEGEVIIQTFNPKHFVLQKVLMGDYEGFYNKTILERDQMNYPPFVHLCLIESKDENEEAAKNAIEDFYKELTAYRNYINISAPAPALIAKLKGFYRFHLLIKSNKNEDKGGVKMKQAIYKAFTEFNRKSRYNDVKLFYDVDPQSII